jgi:hypothetical protein
LTTRIPKRRIPKRYRRRWRRRRRRRGMAFNQKI